LRSKTRETSLIDQKLERATEGLEPYFLEHLKTKISRENGIVIAEYISSMRIETNLSDNHRRGVITSLKLLSEFLNNKYFIDMTKEDVLSYLDRLRKPDEFLIRFHLSKPGLRIIHKVEILLLFYFVDWAREREDKSHAMQSTTSMNGTRKKSYLL